MKMSEEKKQLMATRKLILLLGLVLASLAAWGQQCVPSTTQTCSPNVGLANPNLNSPNWNVPIVQNNNWLDSLLGCTSSTGEFGISFLSQKML
jgi:hypothetical protein